MGGAIHVVLHQRDPEIEALARAELSALGGGGEAAEPGVWLSPAPVSWTGCGYGSAGGGQLAFATTLDGLVDEVRALAIEAPRYRLAIARIPQRRRGATEAKIHVAAALGGVESDEDPDLRLLLVVSPAGYRLLREMPVTQGESDWLRASHKPNPYAVALPVRLAKAALNLTARPGDVVLDPFCGSGTIPILAELAGHRAYGSDVSGVAVARARENLAAFGCTSPLAVVDARETAQRADCIVTNPPYGLRSHLAPEARREVLRNLARLAPRATFVTPERLEDDLAEAGFELERVIPVAENRFQRFVYLTRSRACAA